MWADTCASILVTDPTRGTGLPAPRVQADLVAADELPLWLGDEGFHLEL